MNKTTQSIALIAIIALLFFGCYPQQTKETAPCINNLPIKPNKSRPEIDWSTLPDDLKSTKAYILKLEAIAIANPDVNFSKIQADSLSNAINRLDQVLATNQINWLKSKAHRLLSTYLIFQEENKGAVVQLETALRSINGNQLQDSLELVEIYNLLGITYENLLNIPLSRHYHQKALQFNQQLGRIEDVISEIANIGLTYQYTNEPDSAIFYLEEAACIFKNYEQPLNMLARDSLGLYHNLSLAYRLAAEKAKKEGNTVVADDYYQKSIDGFRSTFLYFKQLNSRKGTENFHLTTINLAATFLNYDKQKLHTADSALLYLQLATDTIKARAGGLPPFFQHYIETRVSLALAQKGNCSLALTTINNLPKDGIPPNFLMQAAYIHAQIIEICETSFEGLDKKWAAQMEAHTRDLATLDEVLVTPGMESTILAIRKRFKYHFQAAIESAVGHYQYKSQIPQFEKTLQIADQSKSYRLKQSIFQQIGNQSFIGKFRNLLQEEQHLREQIKKYPNDVRPVQAFDAFVERLKDGTDSEEYAYYIKRFTGPTITLPEIRQNLLKPKSAIIQYYLSPLKGYALALTADKQEIFTFNVNPQLIEQCQEINASLDPLNPRNSYFRQTAHPIYQQIFQPIDEWLRKEAPLVNDLTIIPDGFLHNIPFEGLLSKAHQGAQYGDLDYLFNKYFISYHYSIESMLALKRLKKLQPKTNKQFTAFVAYPTSSNNQTNNTESFVGCSSNPLPNLHQASTNIAQKLKENGWQVEVTANATEALFNQSARNNTILQFTMHGCLDPNNPLHSYLQFATDPKRPMDGQLTIEEIYQLNRTAELAVLSNCSTLQGAQEEGEAFISLARAFTYSGFQAVIGTIQVIEDTPSAIILDNFYTQLLQGQAKHIALTKAKQAYLKKHKNAHPQQWLSMVCMGDTAPISSITPAQ